MTEVTLAGGIVAPPVPAFYHRPQTVDDIVDQTVGRALDLFDIDVGRLRRWAGDRDGAVRARHDRAKEPTDDLVPPDGTTREHAPG